jgi:hypothetical protein
MDAGQGITCLALLLAVALAPTRASAARLVVCAFSFHGPREIQVFKDRLSSDDFDVIDLSPHQLPVAMPAPPRAGDRADPARWLFRLCRPDLRCDVVVYSAEFAGSFFGAYGKALDLRDMEEASCQARCDGLFHDPREVFLLGCNTLATKAQDTRTPAQYLQVLMDHGFDRTTAERVVGTRYGPLGPSFRESLRRVFMGVPRLYGFASVAPAGEHTAPLLDRYFRTKGDYRRYLEQAGRDTGRNAELLAAFRGTGLVQSTGLTRAEPAAVDRDAVCRLYDEREPVATRLRVVLGMLARTDFLAFVPTIQVLFDRHPPERMTGTERALFEEIQRSEAPREEVLRLVHELEVSALRLELAHFARHLGWLSPAAFRTLALDAARELMRRPLSTDVVDVMCEIPRHESLRNEFGSDDLPPRLFEHHEGIRLVDCLSPADPRVSARLLPGLDHPELSTRLWAAYALSRRLPLDEAILTRLASHLDDPSEELRERLRWTFRAQVPLSEAVRRAIAARDPGLAEALRPPARRRGFFR